MFSILKGWLLYCNIDFVVLLVRHQKENVPVAFSGNNRNTICLSTFMCSLNVVADSHVPVERNVLKSICH